MAKRPTDPNQLARKIIGIATGEEDESKVRKKDPAAVSLGRRGGLKGGKARAEKLSPQERKAIAKKAAEKRWAKSDT
ncbi:hypothetical protein AB7M49_002258 [Bradyrhizobium elkanii]